MLVHVVDAAAEDPVNDYRTVKEVCLPLSSVKFCFLLPGKIALIPFANDFWP